jgi:type III secretion protein C
MTACCSERSSSFSAGPARPARSDLPPRIRSKAVFALLAWTALGTTAGTAVAAQLTLPETPYSYTVIDQDLAAALQEFGSNLSIKVNVSPEVRGRIQGRLPELSPRAYLDRLAALYNFEWYYDGLVVHISSVREAQSRLLVVSPLPFEKLRYALDALGVSDSRYVVRPAPGSGLALVSGPPRFVSLVEQTLAGLIAEEQARPRTTQSPRGPLPPMPLLRETLLTIFRGSDTTIVRDGRPENIAGLDDRRRPARTAEQ